MEYVGMEEDGPFNPNYLRNVEDPIPQLFQSIIHASEIVKRVDNIVTVIITRLEGSCTIQASKFKNNGSASVGAMREASMLVDSLANLADRLEGVLNRIG